MKKTHRAAPPGSRAGRPPGAERHTRPREPRSAPPYGVSNRWLRWAADRSGSAYAVLGLFLSLGLLASAAAAVALALLAGAVVQGSAQRMDVALMEWVARFHHPTLDRIALEVTALGSVAVVALVVLVSSALLGNSVPRHAVPLLWAAAVGAIVLYTVLKAGFDRPRPDVFVWRTPYAGQASFPSGHATLAMAAYGMLAYLVARLERPQWVRVLAWTAAAGLILLIGATRVYLGVHYPTDVLAGFVIGSAWAAVCAAGIRVVRHSRAREPEADRGAPGTERQPSP